MISVEKVVFRCLPKKKKKIEQGAFATDLPDLYLRKLGYSEF